jgi:hypothetical protein
MVNNCIRLALILLLLLPTAVAKEDDSTSVKMTTCKEYVSLQVQTIHSTENTYPMMQDLALDSTNVHTDLTKNLLILRV